MKIVGKKQEQVNADVLKLKGDIILQIRKSWHITVGNPLFFDEQLGEVPKGTWKKAVEDMKAANPYPDGYIKGG